MKILVIEDHHILSRNIIRYLASKDLHAQACFDGVSGEYAASTKYFDVIILDINLPERDGLEVCKNLREKGNITPILMLTSRATSEDIVTGLEVGADDYLVKPFEYTELLARLNALTRRSLGNKSTSSISIGALNIDMKTREVQYNNEPVSLSEKEFELLAYLSQNPGKALSREEIYEKVWGESQNDFTAGKTLDVYIGYLRKKLSKELIETKKGYGFCINS